MNEVQIRDLSLVIENRDILRGVNLSMSTGELVVILGSNGAGKSTLMKCALGLLDQSTGTVSVDGQAVGSLSSLDKAKKLSYLPQKRPMAWPILVKDVVALGRFAYGTSIGRLSGEDKAAVSRAIHQCDLDDLKDRRIDTLSGGETTRVHCARTFAAEAPLLFADEPTTALDPRHQLDIMSLLKSYVSPSRGALVVAHEPALAARFADRLVWMKDGEIVADGSPAETLNASLLETVYDVEARVSFNGDRPAVDFIKPK
jgi:iron complex transport system ATP-binding protein